MDAITLFRTSLAALWTNKLRTSLTLLGIVIGVAAVIALMAIGRGAQKQIVDSITALGTNLIYVQPSFGGPIFLGQESGGARGAMVGGRQFQFPGPGGNTSQLTLEDAYALLDPVYAPSVLAVAPEVNTSAQIMFGRRNTWASVIGTTPDYLSVRNIGMAMGSFIAQPHVDSRAEVVVLGSEIAKQLFDHRDPTGQKVRLNGREYTVLGVLEKLGGNSFGFFDYQVIVPITTAYYRLNGQGSTVGGMPVQNITVEARSDKAVPQAMREVESILRLRHRLTGENDFEITSQQQAIDALRGATSTFVIFLAAIAGISLVVGGIGIMNIMLVSVTERTREIGIRKALGARRTDILFQFSVEAVLISLTGGVVGIIIGYVLARVAAVLVSLGESGIPGGGSPRLEAVFSPDVTLLALVVSAGIGLFFGIYPAVRAARLQPVEALRR